jgi:methylmalonyl-CoA mutase, N-terminal domain
VSPPAGPVATKPGISASRVNERLRSLAGEGQTALSVAFDLPTQFGFDSGDPIAAGEVGRAGVAIDTASDMCEAFAGIPLGEVSVNFPVNAAAPIILAAYLVAAERSGITGCPWRRAGCDPAAELALAMASAIAYCEAFLARGLRFEAFAPRLSFRFAATQDLTSEAAKLRAARRIWHRVATERLGATSPAAARLRFFSCSPGSTVPAAHQHPPQTGAGTAGSCCVEPVADEIEARASALLAEIDALGSTVAAIEAGIPQRWIAESGPGADAQPKRTSDADRLAGARAHDDALEMDPLAGDRQAARTREAVAARDPRAFIGALLRLADDTRAGRNVMPALIAAARAGTTAGEMTDVFRDAFGTFTGPAPW